MIGRSNSGCDLAANLNGMSLKVSEDGRKCYAGKEGGRYEQPAADGEFHGLNSPRKAIRIETKKIATAIPIVRGFGNPLLLDAK